jgi:hypothetical protein
VKRFAWCLLGLGAIAVAAAQACSAGGDQGNNSTSTAKGGGGSGATGGSPATGGSGGSLSGPGPGSGGGETCAEVGSEADQDLLPADVILVIDNSGSMTDEAGEVQASMNDFVATITAAMIDVHVILISADSGDEQGICVPAPLGSGSCPNDDNQPGGFMHVVNSVGSNDGLQKILDSYATFSSFLRPNGTRTIGIITDDESSKDAATFMTEIVALDPTFADLTFHGIVAPYELDTSACIPCSFGGMCSSCDPCCGPDPVLGFGCFSWAEAEGAVYKDLAMGSGGVIGNLCLQEFSPMFNAMATAVIGGSQVACVYEIPDPPNGESIDYGKVNVEFYPTPTSMPEDFFNVPGGEGDCGASADGWYYDNPSSPTQILLCPETCAYAQMSPEGEIKVLFGCETVIK